MGQCCCCHGNSSSETSEGDEKGEEIEMKKAACLTKVQMEDLLKHTKFTKEEIKEWHAAFREAFPCGRMTYDNYTEIVLRVVFKKGPEHVSVSGDKLMHHLDLSFRQYDIDGRHDITFREFLIGMSISTKGTLEERIQWAFSLYDIDKDGIITLQEMNEILTLAEKAYGDAKSKEEMEKFVNFIFTYLDADHNGVISVVEFILGLKTQPELFQYFTGASDVLSSFQAKDFEPPKPLPKQKSSRSLTS